MTAKALWNRSNMAVIMTSTDIEKLVLARDMLQEQIDARVAARGAQKPLMNRAFCKGGIDQ